jgi:hypothetical protein
VFYEVDQGYHGMPQKQWVHDADNAGTKIPEAVRQRTEKRLRRRGIR